jgi:hypothetical protein
MRQALTCIHRDDRQYGQLADVPQQPFQSAVLARRCRYDGWPLLSDALLCVRPENIDFVIGASCDYSFVPEMCPSGNIAVMTIPTTTLSSGETAPTKRAFSGLGPPTPTARSKFVGMDNRASSRQCRHTLIFHAAQPPLPCNRWLPKRMRMSAVSRIY